MLTRGILFNINISIIYVFYESIIYGYKDELLNFIFIFSIFCGIFVIISKNPISSVLFLIGLFLGISCYLILLGENFIGLSYLLVYVGAVSILFVFILMLINVRISELISNTNNSIPLAILIGIVFNNSISILLPYNLAIFNNSLNSETKSDNSFNLSNNALDKNDIVYVTSKTWDGSITETSHITSLGNIMYTSYSIWLIITSIILLLAMVGTIVITIKQKVLV